MDEYAIRSDIPKGPEGKGTAWIETEKKKKMLPISLAQMDEKGRRAGRPSLAKRVAQWHAEDRGGNRRTALTPVISQQS